MVMFLSWKVIDSEALAGYTLYIWGYKVAFECIIIDLKLIQAK